MSCEICGGELSGRGTKISVEGTIMVVCNNCRDLGEVVRPKSSRKRYLRSKSRSTTRVQNRKKTPRKSHQHKPKRRRNSFSLDIVPNYADVIKKARGKMTHDEFADKLNEKSSLIHKLESGKLKPTIKLARRIEKNFHVKLLESEEQSEDIDDISWKSDNKGKYVPTLGDFIKDDD